MCVTAAALGNKASHLKASSSAARKKGQALRGTTYSKSFSRGFGEVMKPPPSRSSRNVGRDRAVSMGKPLWVELGE
jgi:hypothetical protein